MQYVIDLVVNFIVFLIGGLFGSFYTLAIYRLPLKKNITRERSFCPNCKHKLSFFDLFPIFSYMFLRGKCRYCKTKIGSKYVFIELFTAAIFIMFFNSLKFMEIATIQELILKLTEMFMFIMFYTFMFLTAFIDKEKYKIEDNLLRFGIIISILYVLITYILHSSVNYVYMLASATMLIFLYIMSEVIKIHRIRIRYYLKLLMFFVILSIYIPIKIIVFTSIILIPIYLVMYITQKIILKKEKKKSKNNNNLVEEKSVEIKVEFEDGLEKIYIVEKKLIVEKKETKGKLLKLKDLKLKNITDEIHIPFALLIGLISFILFIILKIF